KEEYQQFLIEKKGAKMEDNLFINSEVREFNSKDIENFMKTDVNLEKVSEDLKEELITCLDYPTQVLDAYHTNFSIKNKQSVVVLIVSTMESKYIVLAFIKANSEIESCIQLTEDRCDLIKQH